MLVKHSVFMSFLNSISFCNFTLLPEYFLGVCSMYLLLTTILIISSNTQLVLQKVFCECLALTLIMACYLLVNDDLLTLNFISFHNCIVNDELSYITRFLICFFSALFFLLISNSLKEQKLVSFEYLLILLFAILGLMLTCSSNDFLTIYLALELSSLALFILASFRKSSSYSIDSGLKYFITGAVSSSFFLFGSSLIYISTGSIYFDDFVTLYESNQFFYYNRFNPYYLALWSKAWIAFHVLGINDRELCYDFLPPYDPFFNQADYSFLDIGLAFIVFSLFIKLACAPFHLWSLDVYEGSPTSSSFFLSVISKLSIFVLLIRLCYVNFYSIVDESNFYCFWFGLFSIFVGSFGGLWQRRTKTLLAYSSITNIGYGILALATNFSFGIEVLYLHLIIYTIAGLCIWSFFMLIQLRTKKITNKFSKDLTDIALLNKVNPTLAFILSLVMFSVAGLPPLLGFLPKASIFYVVLKDYFFFLL